MSKGVMPKAMFWVTIVQGVYRDSFTNASDINVFVGVIMGLIAAIAFKQIFEVES